MNAPIQRREKVSQKVVVDLFKDKLLGPRVRDVVLCDESQNCHDEEPQFSPSEEYRAYTGVVGLPKACRT